MLSMLLPTVALALEPLDVREETLANGVHVVVHSDPALLDLAVRVRLGEGANSDPMGRSGLCHLLEHLLFEASAHATQTQRLRLLAEVGGQIEAFTRPDDVMFHLRTPPEALEPALHLLSEQLGAPGFDAADLKNQVAVVAHERAGRWWSTLLEAQVLRFLIPVGSPYARFGIGKAADLKGVQLKEARAAAAHLVRPANMTLVIVGPASPEASFAAARRWFGALRAPEVARTTYPPILPAPVEPAPIERSAWRRARPPERVWVDTDVDEPTLRRAWRTFPVGGADQLALTVAASVLQNGMDAEDLEAQAWFGREGGYLILAGESSQPRAFARRLTDEVERLAWDGPTADELDLVRATYARWSAESRDNADTRAAVLTDCLAIHGVADCEGRVDAALAALEPEAVRRAVHRWMRPELGAWVGISSTRAPLPGMYRQFAR